MVIDVFSLGFVVLPLVNMEFWYIVVARLGLGFVIGISTSLVPEYIRIMSPIQIVGKMGTINQLMQTIGVLLTCIFGFFCIYINE